ncbi:hypothetical protein SDC9_130609 [bioreactor metagenome]|uniref:Uncharacterized protein n=1 Tax=bioreactor metagenome TaxID=1076179 RepID=A0A645D300_9ZZZZ
MNLIIRRGNAFGDLCLESGFQRVVGILFREISTEPVNIHLHACGIELFLEDFERTRIYIGRALALRLRLEGIHVVLHLFFDLRFNVGLLFVGQRDAHEIRFVKLNLVGDQRCNHAVLHGFNVSILGRRSHAVIGVHLHHVVVLIRNIAPGDGVFIANFDGDRIVVNGVSAARVGARCRIGRVVLERTAHDGQHQRNCQQGSQHLLPFEILHV